MSKVIIGIDPGANGGIAVGHDDGRLIAVAPMPATPKDLFDCLAEIHDDTPKEYGEIEAYLEKVGGMPGQGGMAMFTFGKGFGHLEMALLSLGIKTNEVTPQKWQKHFQLGSSTKCASKTEWKNKLKAKAQQLFPNEKVTLKTADALLIYQYGCAQK
jgi:hypothetical protein